MKRNSFLFVISLTIVIASCDTVDKKVPEITTDICNCFSPLDKQMSADLKAIFIKAGNAEKPTETLSSELELLPPGKRDTVLKEMQILMVIGDPSSEINQCMAGFKKKYGGGKTKDRDKFYENLFAEMKNRSGCELALAAMKLSYKETKK